MKRRSLRRKAKYSRLKTEMEPLLGNEDNASLSDEGLGRETPPIGEPGNLISDALSDEVELKRLYELVLSQVEIETAEYNSKIQRQIAEFKRTKKKPHKYANFSEKSLPQETLEDFRVLVENVVSIAKDLSVREENSLLIRALIDGFGAKDDFKQKLPHQVEVCYLARYIEHKYGMSEKDAQEAVKFTGRYAFRHYNTIPKGMEMFREIQSKDPKLAQRLETVYGIDDSWDNYFDLLQNLEVLKDSSPSYGVQYDTEDKIAIWKEALFDKTESGEYTKVSPKAFSRRPAQAMIKVDRDIRFRKERKVEVEKPVKPEPVKKTYIFPEDVQDRLNTIASVNPELVEVLNQAYDSDQDLDTYEGVLNQILEVYGPDLKFNDVFKDKAKAVVRMAKTFPLSGHKGYMTVLKEALMMDPSYSGDMTVLSRYFKAYLMDTGIMDSNDAAKYIAQLEKNNALSSVMALEHRIAIKENDPEYLEELRSVYLGSHPTIDQIKAYIDVMQAVQSVSEALDMKQPGRFAHYYSAPEKFWRKVPCLLRDSNGELVPVSAAEAKKFYVMAYQTDQFWNNAKENQIGTTVYNLVSPMKAKVRTPKEYIQSYAKKHLATDKDVNRYIRQNGKKNEQVSKQVNLCVSLISKILEDIGVYSDMSREAQIAAKQDMRIKLADFEFEYGSEALDRLFEKLEGIQDKNIFDQQDRLIDLWTELEDLGRYPFRVIEEDPMDEFIRKFEKTGGEITDLVKACTDTISLLHTSFGLDKGMSEEQQDVSRYKLSMKLAKFESEAGSEALEKFHNKLKEDLVDDSLYNQQARLIELWEDCRLLGDYPYREAKFRNWSSFEMVRIPLTTRIARWFEGVFNWIKSLVSGSELGNKTIFFEDPLFKEGEEKLPNLNANGSPRASDTLSKDAPKKADTKTVDHDGVENEVEHKLQR